jgi:hypothetical protein
MSGIIPRPKLTRLYTVLRSPHIDKKARDQFHMIVRCAPMPPLARMPAASSSPFASCDMLPQEASCDCEVGHAASVGGFPSGIGAGGAAALLLPPLPPPQESVTLRRRWIRREWI